MATREEIKKKIDELKNQIRAEAEDVEDFHEAYTELIVDLEREAKKMYSEIYEKEGLKETQKELIELFDSKGKSTLVLRIENLEKEEFKTEKEKAKKMLERK
ncbi:hypothetical protein HY992_00305 [Candidatus Micrarchaeota archaeon]|nr:hypothetical protein [Candidatus Micrarchaeota archaeon]